MGGKHVRRKWREGGEEGAGEVGGNKVKFAILHLIKIFEKILLNHCILGGILLSSLEFHESCFNLCLHLCFLLLLILELEKQSPLVYLVLEGIKFPKWCCKFLYLVLEGIKFSTWCCKFL